MRGSAPGANDAGIEVKFHFPGSIFGPGVALACLVAIGAGVSTLFRYPLALDDPYITFRYARNLQLGQGLVFNPGQPVLGTTAPLYAALLAMGGRLGADIPTLGYGLGVSGFIATSGFLFLLGLHSRISAGWIGGLFILTCPALVATVGLETGMFMALALGSIYTYCRGRSLVTAGLLAALTLTRPDGVLLACILFIDMVRLSIRRPGGWKAPVRAVALYVGILAPAIVTAWWVYGSPFPSTLPAKLAQAQSGLWAHFLPGIIEWGSSFAQANWLLVLLAGVGTLFAWLEFRPVLFLGGWGLAHLTAYSLLGVAFYAWYLAPALVAVLALSGVGIMGIGQRVLSHQHQNAAAGMLGRAIPILLVGAVLTIQLEQLFASGMDHPQPKAEVYRQAGEWLASQTEPDASVDALEIGLLGYYDQRPTFDFVGLVDPSRLPYLARGYLSDGVRQRSAEYVVAIPPDEWLALDPWFNGAYRIAQKYSRPGFYNGRPLLIYRRVDLGLAKRAIPVHASFEKGVQLVSAELPAAPAHTGSVLPIVLFLKTAQPLSHEFKITLQLVDGQGAKVAQTDTFFPLRLNGTGTQFADVNGIAIPPATPAGEYSLFMALYFAPTEDRLAILDGNGEEGSDWVLLGRILIE